MQPIFLDTGYVIALEAADDQYHDSALRHWQNLIQSLPPLVTTSYVVDEVVTFFNSRNRHAKAVEVGNRLIQSSLVQLIRRNHKTITTIRQEYNKLVREPNSETTNRIILSVEIEGISTNAVVDTGAPYVICEPRIQDLRKSHGESRTHLTAL